MLPWDDWEDLKLPRTWASNAVAQINDVFMLLVDGVHGVKTTDKEKNCCEGRLISCTSKCRDWPFGLGHRNSPSEIWTDFS